MNSRPGKPTIAIPILPYISRSEDNQTMEFCQLIECGKYFSQKLVPHPFSKSFWNFIIYFYVQLENYPNIALTSNEAFLKNKKKSGTSFPPFQKRKQSTDRS